MSNPVYQMTTTDGSFTGPLPVKAAVLIAAGAFFGVDSAGRAVPADDATAQRIAGRATAEADNTAVGAVDGDVTVYAERLTYSCENSATDPVTAADVLNPVYLESENVIRRTRTSANQPVAGIFLGFDGTDPLVQIVPGLTGAAVGMHDADGATLLAFQSGALITNLGAAGAATFVLPAAVPGLEFRFAVKVAQQLRIDPAGTETIEVPSTAAQGAAGKYLWADAIGEFIHIRCLVAGAWSVVNFAGTWTIEA
jgi:hypothetical protein